MKKRALIFGISGQDGSYLAKLLLEKNYEVYGCSRDAEICSFYGLKFLCIFEKVKLTSANLNDYRSVQYTLSSIAPDEVYNLSAQSSVGLSFEQPTETINSILNATLNLLEVIRILPKKPKLYNASSSEIFGDTNSNAAHENTSFNPRSPYGVSKAAAHWMIKNYRNSYNLYACSGILFNHESPLRNERFVTQKIIRAAIGIKSGATSSLQLGNLSIIRDWGWAPEYVEAMWLMLQQKEPKEYIIATGKETSLEKFISIVFNKLEINWKEHITHDVKLLRPYEVNHTVGNASLAKKELGWEAKVPIEEIIQKLISAESLRIKISSGT
jgi:GDPmannose 4,6-dehydratase